jgi:carbonic anhydrase
MNRHVRKEIEKNTNNDLRVKGKEPLLSKGEKMVGEIELQRLLDGNKRYVENKLTEKNMPETRKQLLSGQHPFATVITCSDSRVVPSYIFDTNIGEIFKIETAGNILDKISLGSLEYGVDHLKTPLVVILAHTKCGAVTAACSGGHAEGNIAAIVKKIKPAAKKAKNDVEKAVDINAIRVKEEMLRKSAIVKKAVEEGRVKIVVMKYDLDTGEVKLLE